MNKKRLVMGILIAIPVIIVIAAIIYISIIIINNRNPYDDYSDYRGSFSNIDATDEFVVNRYFKQIARILEESDVSALQSIIDENDSKYYIMGSRRFG